MGVKILAWMEAKSADSGGREPLLPATSGWPFASNPLPLPAQAAMLNKVSTTPARDAGGPKKCRNAIISLEGCQ
jgi:hypothetical protein